MGIFFFDNQAYFPVAAEMTKREVVSLLSFDLLYCSY